MGTAGGLGRKGTADGEIPRDLIVEGLHRLGVEPDPAALDGLVLHLEQVLLWSRRMDLVKVADTRDLVVRHLLDSVAAVQTLRALIEKIGAPAPRLCDVGSGAGFPGVPLALCLPIPDVILLERSARRATFLKTVCALVRRDGLTVWDRDLDGVARDGERFDLVVTRALSPFGDEAVTSLARITSPRGALLIYQGREDTAAHTRDRLAERFISVEMIETEVPFLAAERRLVIAATPRD